MNSQTTSANQPKSRTSRKIAVVVFAVIIIIASVFVALEIRKGELSTPLPHSTPVLVNRILLNGTITVDAGSYWYLQFIIPSDSDQIQVSGSLTVLGGVGNEVSVYIMNESSFDNWIPEQSALNVNASYNSGQQTTGNITASLYSGGIFYLVYDNIFSTSQKDVNTQVNLSYWYLPAS